MTALPYLRQVLSEEDVSRGVRLILVICSLLMDLMQLYWTTSMEYSVYYVGDFSSGDKSVYFVILLFLLSFLQRGGCHDRHHTWSTYKSHNPTDFILLCYSVIYISVSSPPPPRSKYSIFLW